MENAEYEHNKIVKCYRDVLMNYHAYERTGRR